MLKASNTPRSKLEQMRIVARRSAYRVLSSAAPHVFARFATILHGKVQSSSAPYHSCTDSCPYQSTNSDRNYVIAFRLIQLALSCTTPHHDFFQLGVYASSICFRTQLSTTVVASPCVNVLAASMWDWYGRGALFTPMVSGGCTLWPGCLSSKYSCSAVPQGKTCAVTLEPIRGCSQLTFCPIDVNLLPRRGFWNSFCSLNIVH